MLSVSIPFKQTGLATNESIIENFQDFIAWCGDQLFAIVTVVGNTA